MPDRHSDLDQLSSLLGQCLGRIDEQSYRLQRLDDDDDGFERADVLENEAATLQELVSALIENAPVADHSNLNQLVERAVQACIGELGVPIVIRQRLELDLPAIACAPSQLAYAVQRAVVLAVDQLDVGGELIVTTRREGELVAFELESRSSEPMPSERQEQRAETLNEFVVSLGGRCRLAVDDHQSMLLAIELPVALAVDDS